MAEGWIKLHRAIQEHWLWDDEPFTRGQAFIDLLLMVNHKDKKIMFNGELIEVKKGSKITSLRQLSDRWKWSTNKVKKYLEQLQKDGMINYKSDNKKTLLTIENYGVYQGQGNTEETQKEHRSDTEENQKKFKSDAEENQKKTNKNDKEYIKNVKEREEWEEGEEEKVPSLPPLSFPTQIHEKFYEQWGEVAYRTWFYDAVVVEGEIITISSPDNFKNEILRSKYKEDLEILTGKKVEIGG
ncbi:MULTISPECIES: hypothetical protein [Clostridium]|jgi:DNA-binding transcriptional regulator YhcF (GntR family)|uniref:hypothetical protein n=1 Tax=Clostridium TaxID=1485 RepID=UPI000822BA26|nr:MULTISPECIES: hypothetical protein [Clostridium]MBX9184456.1 hypothetical protein [Clostridium sp. K04]SCJ89968.1 Uncharacterised protein [uncultured Clostridium sp.]